MFPILRRRRRRLQNLRLIQQRRFIRNNSHPFDLSDRRFIELFRLNKALAQDLIDMLEPFLRTPIRNHGISLETGVLAVLRFYATGCYQRSVGQDFNFGLSQTSISRCIRTVTQAIDEHLAPDWIKFPTTRNARMEIKVAFMDKWNFPGVIGAIDCSHIAILKPEMEEHNFINRKGYHSLNVQVVCNDHLIITHLNPNYGGSSHDSFIWRNSELQRYMQHVHREGETNSWLIGDSGYPLQPYLLTPVQDPPDGSPEAAYNTAHKSARNVIERTFGVLKMRFRCLLKERVARYDPNFVASLITVCTSLHNMCIRNNIPMLGDANDELPPEDRNDPDFDWNQNPIQHNLLREGRAARQNLINRYFV